jgi:hypothetical protein
MIGHARPSSFSAQRMHVRNARLIGKCGCDQSSKGQSEQNFSSHKSPIRLILARSSHDVANWIKLSSLLGAKTNYDAWQRIHAIPGTAHATAGARQRPKLSTLNKWCRALEGAGVEFIDEDEDGERGPGVRLRHGSKPASKRK